MTISSKARNAFTGELDQGIAASEVCGVIGGILGGVMAMSESGSKAAGLAGAVVGGIGGYGMGTFLSPVSNHMGTGAKILTSAISASFGLSVGQLAGVVATSIGKLGDR